MKAITLPCAALAWLLALSCAQSADVQPVLVTLRNEVTVASTGTGPMPAVEKQAVPLGSEVATGKKSDAVVSIVPGIQARLKEKTVITLKTAHISDTERLAEIDLIKGRVQCRLEKQGTAKQVYRVATANGERVEAVGTMWQSGSEGPKRHVAVIEGTVSWHCLPYVEDVSVPAGSVLISEYKGNGSDAILVTAYAVNLVDGTVIIYYPREGTEPKVLPATAQQLKEARDLFSDALGDQLENLKSDNPIFGLINNTLGRAGLGPVFGGGPPNGPPPGGGKGIGLGDATSTIAP